MDKDIVNPTLQTPYLTNNKAGDYLDHLNIPFEIGFNFKNKLKISLITFYDNYENSWHIEHPNSSFVSLTFTQEVGMHFGVKSSYKILGLFNNKLVFRLGCGFTFLKGNMYIGKIDTDKIYRYQLGNETGGVTQTETDDFLDISYGFHKYYTFANAFARAESKLYRNFNLFVEFGYQKGFKTMSYMQGRYRIVGNGVPEDAEWKYFKNEQDGSNISWTFGLMYEFEIKKKSKETK